MKTVYVSPFKIIFLLNKNNFEWKKYPFCGQSKSQKMEIEKLNLKRSFV